MTAGSILAGTWGVIRRDWRAVLVWGLVNLGLSLAMRAAIGPILRAQAEGGGPLPPWWLLTLAWALFALALVALYTAAFRAVLMPGERHAAYLRIGMDELRVVALAVLLYLGLVIATFPLGLVGSLVAVAFSATAGSAAAPVFLLTAGVFVFMLWVAIRLSPAFPLTVLRRRIVVKEAWRMTAGHVVPLLLAYAAGTAAMLLVSLVLLYPLAGSQLAGFDPAAPDAAARLAALQAGSLSLSADPLALALQLVGALLGGLMVAVMGAMPAVATAQMLGRRQEDGDEFRA